MNKKQSSLSDSLIAFIDLAHELAHTIQHLTPKGREFLNAYLAELRIVIAEAFDKQDNGELLNDEAIIAYIMQSEPLSTLHAAFMREKMKVYQNDSCK